MIGRQKKSTKERKEEGEKKKISFDIAMVKKIKKKNI